MSRPLSRQVAFLLTIANFGGFVAGAREVSSITYKGYLVDLYCYALSNAGGRALDGTNVIVDPSQHTLHCLRDPSPCRGDGYYLAIQNNVTNLYDIMFRFDAAGNQAALGLLDSLTGDRVPGLFTVTASGITNGNGFLTNAIVSECSPPGSLECNSICTSNTSVGCQQAQFEPTIAPRPLVILHVCCMLISWGCLLPLGVLWARNMKWWDKKLCEVPAWFQGHRIVQSVGWSFQLLGFILIFFAKGGFGGKGHFQTPHEIVGLIVVTIGTLQPLNAQLRHLPFVGHAPKDAEARSWGRFLWEVLHKGFGYTAVLLGAVNIILGILYALSFNFRGALVPFAIGFSSFSLGTLLIIGLVVEVSRLVTTTRKLCGEEADEEEDEEEGPKDAGEENEDGL